MSYRRRILLINKKFQLKFSFFVTSWTLVLSLVFPSILYGTIEAFTRVLEKKIDLPTLQVIRNLQAETMTAIVLFLIVFMATIFLISIFLSHRIAGPIFRIQSALERWPRGSIEKDVKLRKYDHFIELANSYNAAANQVTNVRNQINVTAEKLQKISAELDPKHRSQIQDLASDLLSAFQKK
jgi:methyl-accepting chemotaxis protein